MHRYMEIKGIIREHVLPTTSLRYCNFFKFPCHVKFCRLPEANRYTVRIDTWLDSKEMRRVGRLDNKHALCEREPIAFAHIFRTSVVLRWRFLTTTARGQHVIFTLILFQMTVLLHRLL
jgi:hypothetical protein